MGEGDGMEEDVEGNRSFPQSCETASAPSTFVNVCGCVSAHVSVFRTGCSTQ